MLSVFLKNVPALIHLKLQLCTPVNMRRCFNVDKKSSQDIVLTLKRRHGLTGKFLFILMYNFIIKVPREYSRTDHCVKSVQIQSYCWSVFSPNTEKYGPEITPRTARKTTFYFSRRPKKMVTPKKLRWNMIFLVLSGKMIFLFPENMILPLRRKMKDDLSHKNTRKYDIFFKCSEKMAFLKSAALGHDLILPVKMVFFPRKHDIFSLGGK